MINLVNKKAWKIYLVLEEDSLEEEEQYEEDEVEKDDQFMEFENIGRVNGQNIGQLKMEEEQALDKLMFKAFAQREIETPEKDKSSESLVEKTTPNQCQNGLVKLQNID